MLTPERIKALRELLRLQVYEILVEGPRHEALTADFNELCDAATQGLEAGAVVAGMEAKLKRSLWNAAEHKINRHLMSNAHGRWDGAEKGETHRELCRLFISALLDRDIESVSSITPEFKAVHEGTQALTAYLDEVIGFPLDDDRPDYEGLAPKFFEHFYTLAQAALAQAKLPDGEGR
jgi:hypothetical protein